MMEKGLSAAATPLARADEILLAFMNEAKAAAVTARQNGDHQSAISAAYTMAGLHREIRKSVLIPQAQTTYTFTDENWQIIPQAQTTYTFTDENWQKLCARMVEMAREANRTREASYSMYQLQGAEIALRCLGIPCNVDFAPDICKRISVTVGGITMDVDSSE